MFDMTNPTPIKNHKDHVHINQILNPHLSGQDEIFLPVEWKAQNMTQIIMQHLELFRKFIKIWESDCPFVSCVDPCVISVIFNSCRPVVSFDDAYNNSLRASSVGAKMILLSYLTQIFSFSAQFCPRRAVHWQLAAGRQMEVWW